MDFLFCFYSEQGKYLAHSQFYCSTFGHIEYVKERRPNEPIV